MDYILAKHQWNWIVSGVAIGSIFLIIIVLLEPVDVSSQFIALDSIFLDKTSDAVKESTNYDSLIFIISLFVGGFLASALQRHKFHSDILRSPSVWRHRFGNSLSKRYLASFIGGMLVLFGAGLAGGCTSGHIISGVMQTSLSGYVFAVVSFSVAIPFAMALYRGSK